MNKRGVVNSVQANGTWQGKFGLMYKYEVSIGEDVGEYSSKSENQNKFVIGQEVDYEVTQGQFGNKIKPSFQQNAPQSFGGGGGGFKTNDSDKQMMIVKQSSLNRAVDMLIADKIPKKDVLKVAQSFADWVMETPKNGASLETQLKHTPQNVEVAKVKKEVKKEVEAFATASGQDSFSDGDLPF